MAVPSEKTPLVPQDLARKRLRRFHSAPIESFVSTRMDMDTLRLSYAAKLVLAAVEARDVETAVDLFLGVKGTFDFANLLAYPLYMTFVVCVILGHLLLAMWEGGARPFPLNPVVAVLEAFAFLCYTGHVFINLWTFGAKQFRDKRWHLAFAVVSTGHCLLLIFAMTYARWQQRAGDASDAATSHKWSNAPRLALLAAHALRPMMLISQLRTTRRVFTNVLRTISRTGSFLALWAVGLAFFSVLGTNLFNSQQVVGYSAKGDNFDTFQGAVLSLFVLTTEENFPMVADPAFSQRPYVAYPFFICFLLLFLVVILPLLLGIVLDAYAQEHIRQLDRCRRKARNALLAAYYVLDEDGSMGLSREQVVGVLTTEAGVGINRRQAEQLWRTLVPDDDGDVDSPNNERTRKFNRSHSLPSTTTTPPPRYENTAGAPATGRKTLERRVGFGGRVDVRGFLRLSDLLHEKTVVDSEEELRYDGGLTSPGVSYNVYGSQGHWPADSDRPRENLPRKITEGAFPDGDDGDKVESGRALGGSSMPEGGGKAASEGNGLGLGTGEGSCSTGNVRERRRRCTLERWLSILEGAARQAVHHPWFPKVSQAITILLALLALTWTPMSQEGHDLCLEGRTTSPETTITIRPNDFVCRREIAFRLMEGLALLAFSTEMTTKVLAIGWWQLWRRCWADRFDWVILLASISAYLVVGIPGNKLALYVDRHPLASDLFELPRALVVLRLLTVFPSLRKLLETISTVSVMVVKILVLYVCVSYSFAAIGMALFADSKSDILAPRYSFSTLPEALLALFFLTVTNNWNDLLYPLVNSASIGSWSALYFVTYMLFCSTMFLDVLVGVVIEGFRVSTRGPDAPGVDREEMMVHGERSSTTRIGSFDDRDSTLSALSATGDDRAASPRREIPRKGSQRKYKEVKAEDMFRIAPKGELTAKDMQELEDAVKMVEERLHRAWENHVHSLSIARERLSDHQA